MDTLKKPSTSYNKSESQCTECAGSGSVINEEMYPEVVCMECPQCQGWCYTTNLNVKVS